MTSVSTSSAIRPVYIISDRTAVTAGTMAHALLSQFPSIRFERQTIPFIDTKEKVKSSIRQINESFQEHNVTPLIFTSFMDTNFTQDYKNSDGVVIDLFKPFIHKLEQNLNAASSNILGQAHGIVEEHDYMHRMDAVNFAMKYDDGVKMEGYDRADLILVGVSRAGKTPTSLYMAMHYGLNTANYPIADDDFEKGELPETLVRNRDKLYGLSIDAFQLQKIRQKRRANSAYSAFAQCQREVIQANQFFKRYRIAHTDSTAMSIEELASIVVHRMNLEVSYL